MSGTRFFWLDLDGVDEETHDLLLNDVGVHQLVVDDVQNFGQRPKIEDYDTVTYMVVHGASGDGASIQEVHFILSTHFVITVRRGACAGRWRRYGRGSAISGPRRSSPVRSRSPTSSWTAWSTVSSRCSTSSTPRSTSWRMRSSVKPTEAQLGTLFTMKGSLIGVRKVITPQRDMFAGVTAGVIDLPGATEQGQRYMRDIYDHLIRISDLVDGYRDLRAG